MSVRGIEAMSGRHKRFTSGASAPPLAGGSRTEIGLGPWTLREPLALGSVGVVFDATRGGSGSSTEAVAIHVPLASLQEMDPFRARYEKYTLESMDVVHPNLVRTLDGGRGALVWRVMEPVGGFSLAAIVQRSRARSATIPARVAVHLCAGAGAGLAALQALGRHHGRLSSARAFVDGEGQVKVCGWTAHDLGVSATSLESRGVLAIGELAPEQISGMPSVAATDVWHLGVLLLTLIGGGTPFRGTTPERVIRAVLSDPLSMPTGLPPALTAVLASALARSALARPPLTELTEALDDAKHAMGPLAAEETRSWLSSLFFGVSPQMSLGQHAAGVEVEALRARIARSWPSPHVAPPWTTLSDARRSQVVPLSPPPPSEPPPSEPPPSEPAPRPLVVVPAPVGRAPVPARPTRATPLLWWALAIFLVVGAGVLGTRFGARGRTEAPVRDPAALAPVQASALELAPATLPEPVVAGPTPVSPPEPVVAETAPAAPPERSPRAPAPASTRAKGPMVGVSQARQAEPATASVAPIAAPAPSPIAVVFTTPAPPEQTAAVERAPPAAAARLTDLSVSVSRGKVVLDGRLEGAVSRPLGFLVEDGERCEYRLKMANTGSDLGFERLPIASEVAQGVSVSRSGDGIALLVRCAPGETKVSLSTSPGGFSLTLLTPLASATALK